MRSIRIFASLFMLLFAILFIGCSATTEPEELVYGNDGNDNRGEPAAPPEGDQFLRNATVAGYLGSLDDPDVLATATRGNLLITDCSRFWGIPGLNEDLARLRAENPDLKIIGFFRCKTVRLAWGEPDNPNAFTSELYNASLPHWSYTTAGDTLQDWPNIANYNMISPEARQAMLEIFVRYQEESPNKLDGVYWDYFSDSLWISPDVHSMEGEPDLDGDGVVHWDDEDEIEAYKASQVDCIQEMRSALGEDFIQIVNGSRALRDSSFASLVDGMFYEIFPNVGFKPSEGFIQALNPNQPNNLWAAHQWPRTRNGGPWLILSNKTTPLILQSGGQYSTINLGDFNRVVALLVGGTSVYYDLSGRHVPGYPPVELNLGQAVSDVIIDGNRFEREFENGRIELVMGIGALPVPFSFEIHQDGELVQSFDFPNSFP